MTRFNNSLQELPAHFSKLILLKTEICLVIHGEDKKINNQVALIFDNILFLIFFDIVFRHHYFFSKSSITFQYNHLGSFTLEFVCGKCMGWYFQNKYKCTLKYATVVTSIRKATCVSWSAYQSSKCKFSIEVNLYKTATSQRRPYFLIQTVAFL